MTLVSFVLGMTLDTNYDPRAGVAERPICEQGPFHSAHAVMILFDLQLQLLFTEHAV